MNRPELLNNTDITPIMKNITYNKFIPAVNFNRLVG
jgi:hypothetical protein